MPWRCSCDATSLRSSAATTVARWLAVVAGAIACWVPIMPANAGAKGPAFLLLPNFSVILKYNNAASYALAVAVLAHAVKDDAAAAELIRRDRVDVLFDLAGHSAGACQTDVDRRAARAGGFGYVERIGRCRFGNAGDGGHHRNDQFAAADVVLYQERRRVQHAEAGQRGIVAFLAGAVQRQQRADIDPRRHQQRLAQRLAGGEGGRVGQAQPGGRDHAAHQGKAVRVHAARSQAQHHVTGFDGAAQDAIDGRFLTFEHPGGPFELVNRSVYTGGFHDAAFGGDIAVQHRQPAILRKRVFRSADHAALAEPC